jgi:hypothetical protein
VTGQPTASGATSVKLMIGWVTGQSGAHPRRKVANHQFCDCCTGVVQCAPDSSMHPRTEDGWDLPNEAPAAPRPPRAIKRTPRRHGVVHQVF